ncbi:hypothetical protein [Spirillospora sp. NPDC048819]|uniref:hypothetical protein n=1 Tax=Spirillospora sp. NPDC048819 TaxID=3155268 RepID=UPI0033DEEA46
MHKAADLHARLARATEDIRAFAGRVASNGINQVFDRLIRTGDPDANTIAFLCRVHDLLVSAEDALMVVIEAHREHEGPSGQHGCQHCGKALVPTLPNGISVGPAEAWRRAHLHLPARHDEPILIHIQEFEDGYQAIPILTTIPEPPPVPTLETPTTLVIDKTTGTVTRWPLLPIDVLAKQYHRYQHQEPMTFDGHSEQ